MKPLKTIVTALLFVLLIPKTYAQNTQFLLEANFKDFIPISAIEYDGSIVIAESVGKFTTLTTREIALDKVKLKNFLTDLSMSITIEKADASGKISYAVASGSVEKGSYTVLIDFVRCNTLNLVLKDGTCGGFGKVGVGLRLRANIETKKSGINIGNIFGLALEAQKGNVVGTLSFDVIGINSKDVINLVPVPTEISQSSIMTALQALATIKSKIEDDSTSLHPKLLAIKLSTGGTACGIDAIIRNVNIDNQIQKEQAHQQSQQQQQVQQQVQQQQQQQQQQRE